MLFRSLVHAPERRLEVLLAVAVLGGGYDHERSVGSLEAHVEHALGMDASVLEALALELFAHLGVESVQACLERRPVLCGVEGRRGLLELVGTGLSARE